MAGVSEHLGELKEPGRLPLRVMEQQDLCHDDMVSGRHLIRRPGTSQTRRWTAAPVGLGPRPGQPT